MPHEKQYAISLLTELPFEQSLVQSLIEIKGEFRGEGTCSNNLSAKCSAMQSKQVTYRWRGGQREKWTGIIVHQNGGRAADILEFEPDGFTESNLSNIIIECPAEFVPGYYGVKERRLNGDQTVFCNLRSLLSGLGGPCSLSDRLFHIGRLPVSDSPQGGGFRIETASFRGQDGSEKCEKAGKNERANSRQTIDGFPAVSRPIRKRDEDAGPIIVYGTFTFWKKVVRRVPLTPAILIEARPLKNDCFSLFVSIALRYDMNFVNRIIAVHVIVNVCQKTINL